MIGVTLGPYQVLKKIGEGGMGEVYRAHDPRLRRDVAIKVLPVGVRGDGERLRRFEQEARAAAALSHPNVLTVHEIGVAEGVPYVVSELLEGETLRETLARGPMPAALAAGYALQLLSGLAAAHEKGIIHRDLKPENVFLTADGRVKILDFGLARFLEPDAALAGAMLPTRTAGTTPGVILGTIGYMSPEQVRGQDIDQRSDLFSFGAILYEMLSGERAFEADSPADTMSAILHADPRQLPGSGGGISPELNRVVRHCLEKDAGRRVQSARDLAFDLELVAGMPSASEAHLIPVRSRPPRWRGLVSAAALGILCGGGAAWLLGRMTSQPGRDAPLIQRVARMTHDVGFSEWPTWSPEGRMFAFSSNRAGNFDIYVERVDGSQEVVNVTRNQADNVQPAFSPDGASIAFVSTRSSRTQLAKMASFSGFDFRTYGGDVWVVPALGGRQARRLAEDGNFPVWSPNGRAVAYVSGLENQRSILEVSIDGGSPRSILNAATSTWEIVRLAYSPNGRWITFETTDRQVMAIPAAGGTARKLLDGRAHAWASDGQRVYYVAPEVAGATQIEAADVVEGPTGLAVSAPRVVGTNTRAIHQMVVAPDGQRLLATEIEEALNLARIALTREGGDVAGPEETLSTGEFRDHYPSVSRDGKQILFGSNRGGQNDLWTLDLASREAQRVEMPREKFDNVVGCWSGDSQHLFASTVKDGLNALWSVAVDGSRTKQILPPAPGGAAVNSGLFPCATSPDGRTLVYPRLVGAFTQLALVDLVSRHERQLTTSPSHKYEAAWSPDGRWIAFAANAGGSVNVWRIPAQGGPEEQITSGVERMRHFSYSPDGRWLYLQPNHRNIYRMPAAGGPRRAVTHFPESSSLFIEEPIVSPDGRYFVYDRGHGGSSIWMLTLNAR